MCQRHRLRVRCGVFWVVVRSVVILAVWGHSVAVGQRLPVSSGRLQTVFLPAPRELRQELNKAIKDLEDEQYVDAIARLDLILSSQDDKSAEFGEDYFLPGKDGEPLRSIKSEALRLIGELPIVGREVYQLQHGADAKQMLDRAIERHDLGALANVSRRFFHTPAGYDATMLLGMERLERGRPLAAVLHLQQLLHT